MPNETILSNFSQLDGNIHFVIAGNLRLCMQFMMIDDHLIPTFKKNYLNFHRIDQVTDDKWNLILYLLNDKTGFSKRLSLLTDNKIATLVIQNHLLEFSKLQKETNMLASKAAPKKKANKYAEHVQKGVEIITSLCEQYANQENSSKIIGEKYEEGLKMIIQDKEKTEDINKYRRKKILQELFADVDLFLQNKEKAAFYIDQLDTLLTEETRKVSPKHIKFSKTRSFSTYKGIYEYK